jgi:hypothetical protein
MLFICVCHNTGAFFTARSVRNRGVLLPAGTKLRGHRAVRRWPLRHGGWRGGVHVVLMRGHVHMRGRSPLPCRRQQQLWHKLPRRILLQWGRGGPHCVRRGWVLVPARLLLADRGGVQRRVLWDVCGRVFVRHSHLRGGLLRYVIALLRRWRGG